MQPVEGGHCIFLPLVCALFVAFGAINDSPLSTVQKKKSNVVIEDLFTEAHEDELIKAKPSTAFTPIVASTSAGQKPEASRSQKKKLSPEAREERFNQIHGFVTPRLGRKPIEALPQVRKSAWIHLVGLATSEAQLQKVAEMFPGWHDSGHQFDAAFSELFIRKYSSATVPMLLKCHPLITFSGRCEELACPDIALKIFGDYRRYNVKLTLPGARQLLHSFHTKGTIDKVLTVSALYEVYGLPPIAQDLVSCAMLVSACYKHGSKASLNVANALVPHLEQMLTRTKPMDGPATEKPRDKSQAWLKWTLKKIDKALFVRDGSRAEWMKSWREKSGHLVEPSPSF